MGWINSPNLSFFFSTPTLTNLQRLRHFPLFYGEPIFGFKFCSFEFMSKLFFSCSFFPFLLTHLFPFPQKRLPVFLTTSFPDPIHIFCLRPIFRQPICRQFSSLRHAFIQWHCCLVICKKYKETFYFRLIMQILN